MKTVGLLTLILLLLSGAAIAAEVRLKDSQVFAFAGKLYQNQDYYRAVSEYKRLLHFFPNSSLREKTKLAIAKSYRSGGKTKEAITYLESLPSGLLKKENFTSLLALCYLDLDPAKPFITRQTNQKKALALIQTSQNKRLSSFASEANQLKVETPYSPALAASLSAVVPGLGSATLGRYKEAAYAAFFTLGFGLAMVESKAQEKDDLALGLGFFALAFYGGNIYAAANSAHKLNNQHNQTNLTDLRNKYGIWFSPDSILIIRKF